MNINYDVLNKQFSHVNGYTWVNKQSSLKFMKKNTHF